MPILKLLDDADIITQYVVDEYRTWSSGFYYRIVASVKGNNELHIREYVSNTQRLYSFHLQDAEKNCIIRWDNAPHHENVDTFPCHCHKEGKVMASTAITLDEVLKDIASHLNG